MMPNKLKEFLESLNVTDADEVDQWLDGEPDAINEMREITYPRSSDFFNHPPEEEDKVIVVDEDRGDPAGYNTWGPEFR